MILNSDHMVALVPCGTSTCTSTCTTVLIYSSLNKELPKQSQKHFIYAKGFKDEMHIMRESMGFTY